MYTATQTLVLTERSEDQENEDDPFISANNEVYISHSWRLLLPSNYNSII